MTDKDLREFVARIDERTKGMETQLERLTNQVSCATNREKIKTMEKIVWGAMAAAGTALIKAFWPGAAS